MKDRWYVLHTKPRKEEVAWRQLLQRGFQATYPCLQVRPVNPRARRQRPLFPGYVFVRVDLGAVGAATFQWMPHAHGLVAFDDVPAPVPDALVTAIETRVAALNQASALSRERLRPGDHVVIQSGPFRDHEAIFVAGLSGHGRVRVLLNMLNGRPVPVELVAEQIAATHAERRSPEIWLPGPSGPDQQ